ncbi:hypothetical protein [Natronobacterium texcoconense]|uniref:Uncharacterized protein n=1 Tax=Natronobacterium texcoconense TaxID=1095778 RepID=A0A1H0Z1H2_NATTX|nr:hypothetical protein [Natronobacterium texcoconense]SDQ21210.1 hypothetical protein SAMN04489842_0093 [Natronobacterium texcoconense]
MRRRRLLASVGTILAAGTAGCLARDGPSEERPTIPGIPMNDDETPDDADVELYDTVGIRVLDPESERVHSTSRGNERYAVLGSGDEVDDAVDLDANSNADGPGEERENRIVAYADGTDFAESFLLVVEIHTSSAPDLLPESIERTDDGLRVSLSLTDPNQWTDDRVPHAVLFRIDDEAPSPDGISIDVSGYQ